MFSKPTTFILGAGASNEFGLPLGAALKSEIAEALHFRFRLGSEQMSGDHFLLALLKKKFGNEVNKYTKAGNELGQVIPSFLSIDEALHYYSSRPEIVMLGKLAIVQRILQAEKASSLSPKGGAGVDLSNSSGSWISTFFAMAISAHTMDGISRVFQNLTIINFNYDRSVEQYLYWAFQQRANLSADQSATIVNSLRIIRPYGFVGRLEWQGGTLPFGGHDQQSRNEYFNVLENILTYTEQKTDRDQVTEIRQTLEKSSAVIFLGFGFHEQNVSLLSIARTSAKAIFATVKDINHANYQVMQNRISRCFGTHVTPQFFDLKANQFLESLRPSIALATN